MPFNQLEAAIPGPMVHLSVIHQILSGVSLQSSLLYEFGELMAAVGLPSLSACWRRTLRAISLAAITIATAAVSYAGFWMFINMGFLSNAVLTGSIVRHRRLAMLRGIVDELSRRQLRSAFGQYLSPRWSVPLKQAAPYRNGGITTDISVMFMDVGYDPVESVSSQPQTLTKVINIILMKPAK